VIGEFVRRLVDETMDRDVAALVRRALAAD
jgi:hypothetical protein